MNRRAFFSQLGVGVGSGVAAFAVQPPVQQAVGREPFNVVVHPKNAPGSHIIHVVCHVKWTDKDQARHDWFKTRGELIRAAGESAEDAARDAFVKAGL